MISRLFTYFLLCVYASVVLKSVMYDMIFKNYYSPALDQECYESNRGTTPEEIARNAQIATRTGEG